jgi:hypothetical protein
VGQAPGLPRREAQKGLVDGIDLLLRAELADHRHQAAAHVGIEGIVGGQGAALVLGQQIPDLEIGLAHADAQGLGLVAARHATAVVVGEDHDRAVTQGVVEDPLATDVEVVGVDEGVGALGQRGTLGHGGSPVGVTGTRV